MDISTKYSIGNIVYVILDNGIREYEIRGIDTYTKEETSVYYQLKSTKFNNSQTVQQYEIYTTKEEAGIAWLKSQGLDCGVKHV